MDRGRGRGRALTVPAWMKEQQQQQQSRPSLSLNFNKSQIQSSSNQGSNIDSTDWSEALTSDGKKYWYNTRTGETTWDNPIRSTENPSDQFENPPERQPLDTFSTEAPSPWKEHKTDDGRIYYYNESTRETRWEKPMGFSEAVAPRSVHDRFGTPMDQKDIRSRDDDEDEDRLWKQHFTEDGQVYYVHTRTNETSWEVPKRSSKRQRVDGYDDGNKNILSVSQVEEDRIVNQISEWKQHTTDDGKIYYYNEKTQETSWEIPNDFKALESRASNEADVSKLPAPSKEIRESREPPVNQQREFTAQIKGSKQSRRRKTDVAVQRPRLSNGKPMTDRQAEKFFLDEAEAKRKRKLQKSSKNTNDKKLEKLKHLTESERRQEFWRFLEENHVQVHHSWLECMKMCSRHPQYTQILTTYGQRKMTFDLYIAKLKKQEKIDAILNFRRIREDFGQMLHEYLKDMKPPRSRLLDDCDETAQFAIRADARYLAIEDENEKKDLLLGYFIEREAMEKEARRKVRKQRMKKLKSLMDELGRPSNNNDPPLLNLKMSAKELHNILVDRPEYKDLDDIDRSFVFEDWRKDLDREITQVRAKEREERRLLAKRQRAEFRKGVEELLETEQFSASNLFEEVEEILKQQPWYAPADAQFKQEDIFLDTMESLLDHAKPLKKVFRSILKALAIQVDSKTTLGPVWESARGELEKEGISKVDAVFLLEDLREKLREQERRDAKRIERLKLDLYDIFYKNEITGETIWNNELRAQLMSRSVCRELVELIGDEGIKSEFDTYVLKRKEKEERKKKRKRESVSREELESGDQEQGQDEDDDEDEEEVIASKAAEKKIKVEEVEIKVKAEEVKMKVEAEETALDEADGTQKLEAVEKRKKEILAQLGK